MNNTKGKREDYKARASFSKRKATIIKQMNEIVAQCDVEASFLVFSEAGRAHSFAHPSMENAIARVKNHLKPSEENGTNIEQLVEAHKRENNEMLKKMYAALAEELEMEEENEKNLKGLLENGNESEKKWWEDDEGLSVEELKRKHEAFVELNVNLCATASQQFGKDRSV